MIKIEKPKFDVKNVALYHLQMLRYNLYNDIKLFSNSNYQGKELVCHEMERVYSKVNHIINQLVHDPELSE